MALFKLDFDKMASPTSSTLTPLLSPRAEPEFVKPIPTPLAGVVEKPSAALELLLPICLAAHRFDFKYALDFMTSTWADVDGPRPLDEFGSNQDVVDKTVLKILQETFTYLKSKPIHSLSKEDFEFVTRLRTYAYGAIVLFTVEDNDPARRWCKIMSSCLKDQSFLCL